MAFITHALYLNEAHFEKIPRERIEGETKEARVKIVKPLVCGPTKDLKCEGRSEVAGGRMERSRPLLPVPFVPQSDMPNMPALRQPLIRAWPPS